MLIRKALPALLAGILVCLSLGAQTFETRCTRYSGDTILTQLGASGNQVQINLRDSLIRAHSPRLALSDLIETFYNGHHLGLIIYRSGRPHELIGFWNPDGQPVDGGQLMNGTGEVRTPFNPAEIPNFTNESVQYVSGIKHGPSFYYCDCASVLRRGTFAFNKKGGLWKEFTASGEFIRQEDLKLPDPPIDIKGIGNPVDIEWRGPAHCMMRPDEICPDPIGGGKGGKG